MGKWDQAIRVRERDIKFYQWCLEAARGGLRTCCPADESHWRARIAAYQAVVDALIATRGM